MRDPRIQTFFDHLACYGLQLDNPEDICILDNVAQAILALEREKEKMSAQIEAAGKALKLWQSSAQMIGSDEDLNKIINNKQNIPLLVKEAKAELETRRWFAGWVSI